MKAFLFALLLLSSVAAHSESFNCVDTENVWKISLNYANETATQIKFFKHESLYKTFDEQTVHVSRMRLPFSSSGTMVYEIDLDGINYFDFERQYHGSDIDKTFTGAFLLSSNPFGFENHVTCTLN